MYEYIDYLAPPFWSKTFRCDCVKMSNHLNSEQSQYHGLLSNLMIRKLGKTSGLSVALSLFRTLISSDRSEQFDKYSCNTDTLVIFTISKDFFLDIY